MSDEAKQTRKIRMLVLCDTPTGATGFSMVARNILKRLVDTGRYEIDIIGINYTGNWYDQIKHPYKIFPAMPQGYADLYGRGKLLNALNGIEEKFGLMRPWDIIFTIQDPFVIEGLGLNFPFAEQIKVLSELWRRTVPPEMWFKWVGYFPVDAPVKENWVTRSIALADYPVAYCNWGASQILKYDRPEFETFFNLNTTEDSSKRKARLTTKSIKPRLSIIHHGVDTKEFYPLSKEERLKFRREYFGNLIDDNTFLIINVSRNQPRKDLTRTLAAYAKFKERVPNSHLYLHCRAEDVGGSIHEMARNFNLIEGKEYSTPPDFNEGVGVPVETLNKIYNAADCCMTTTLGEGWGFITTEAMATRVPIIAPNITSILDIFNSYDYDYSTESLGGLAGDYLRGIPVKAGSTSSEWVCLGIEDNERVRPLTNVDDLVDKLEWVHKNKKNKSLQKILDRAYEWVQTQTWESIATQWDGVFSRAFLDLHNERTLGGAIDKVGRNEPCPCKSGEKFKNCHGAPDKMAKYKDWLL